MTDQTNPQPGVSEEAALLQRMVAFNDQFDKNQGQEPPEEKAPAEAKPEAKPAEQPQSQAEAEEVETPEVSAETVEQPADVFELEIVHNDQQVKLSREETIRYAQQGFDYSRKTQAVAEKDRALTESLRRLGEVQQVAPILAQQLAQVKALEAQLAKYGDTNWVQVAAEDPIRYSQERAQFDSIRDAYWAATNEYQRNEQAVMNQVRQIKARRMVEEESRLSNFVPEWRDETKKQAGKQAIVKYLQANGMEPQQLGDEILGSAFVIATLHKARLYDELQKSKASKVGQLRIVPPVTKPGASQAPGAQKQAETEKLQARLRKTGDVKDAAALLLNRWK